MSHDHSPTSALASLLEHTCTARDQATARLFLLVEQERRLAEQQQQLRTYRAQYRERWTTQFRSQAAIEVVQSYQSFVLRLDAALLQLDGQLEASQHQTQQAREALVALEARAAAVRTVLEKRRTDAQRVADRREQRAADELATAAMWRASRSGRSSPTLTAVTPVTAATAA
jgi:flagellar protein FliJ